MHARRRLSRAFACHLLIGAGLAAIAVPSLEAQGAPLVLILQKKASSLGLYDSVSGHRYWTAPVGTKPHEMVLSEGDRFAYVTDYGVDSFTDTAEGGHTVSIVDIEAGRRVGAVDLGRFRRPHGIALGLSGRAYVTVDHPAAVLEVDAERRVVAVEHLLDQKLPHMVVVSGDERYLYTANAGSGTVSRIDRHPGGDVRSAAVGGVPMGLALTRRGDLLYVATRDANTVVLLACPDLTVAGSLDVAGSPARVRLTADDRYLLVTLMRTGELAVIDTGTRREVARLTVGSGAEGLTVDERSGYGYASAQGADRVVKFSLTDWRPVLEIATDASPDPIAVLSGRRVP
jgi:DNA-binding beta-propeller fold protein YncE